MKQIFTFTMLALLNFISCEIKLDEDSEKEEIKEATQNLPVNAKSNSSTQGNGQQSDLQYAVDGTTKFLKNKNVAKSTKGAAIGATAGALTGALIAKDSKKGALIGGVVGVGAGALTGRVTDKTKPRKKLFKNGLFGRRKEESTN
jgi:hypothetical protein